MLTQEDILKKLSKRHFYNGTHYLVDEEYRVVRLTPKFHSDLLNKTLWKQFGFKKVGGTLIGEILEVDKYKSQFVAFIRLAWLDMPILDRKHINAGIILEPKLSLFLSQKLSKDITTYKATDYNFDFFKEKDEIFGGVPDASFVQDKVLLEFKTTNHKNLWNWNSNGVPATYLKQAQLYTYLMNFECYSIVTLFLEESDYEKPESVNLEERVVKSWTFQLDPLQAKDDCEAVRSWYLRVTKEGVSPTWPKNVNQDLLDFLRCKNKEEWEGLLQEWRLANKINFTSFKDESQE